MKIISLSVLFVVLAVGFFFFFSNQVIASNSCTGKQIGDSCTDAVCNNDDKLCCGSFPMLCYANSNYNSVPSASNPCPLGSCQTAIGPIDTNYPTAFIKTMFGILLSLSGGIALLLIIRSGYDLMASQGNAEKVQGARETITSAIVGLLFIIFSLVILQVIGVDILHIPGFGN